MKMKNQKLHLILLIIFVLSSIANCEKNYYELLGVDQKADDKQIRSAFKKLAVQYHPDKIKNTDNKEEAEKKFAEIANAYEVLKDPKLRKKYDNELKYGKQGGMGFDAGSDSHHYRADFGDFDSFFKSFFDDDFEGMKFSFGGDDEGMGMGMGMGFSGGFNFGFGGDDDSGDDELGSMFGGSVFSSSTTFGGMGGESISTSTSYKNGKRQTITKKTRTNQDGTKTITETIQDSTGTQEKIYMIGKDNKVREIKGGNTNKQNVQGGLKQNQNKRQNKQQQQQQQQGFFSSLFDL